MSRERWLLAQLRPLAQGQGLGLDVCAEGAAELKQQGKKQNESWQDQLSRWAIGLKRERKKQGGRNDGREK